MGKLNLVIVLLVAFLCIGEKVAAEEKKPVIGRYNLTKGKQFPLCREYEENLNMFAHLPPMTYERLLHPKFKNFEKPKWEVLDPKKHVSLLREWNIIGLMEDMPAGSKNRRQQIEEGYWKKHGEQYFQEQFAKGFVSLERGVLDLNHDGTKETIYRIVFGDKIVLSESGVPMQKLLPNYQSQPHYHMEVENYDEITDPDRIEKGLQRRTRASSLFWYKGRIYSDQWTFNHITKNGKIFVNEGRVSHFQSPENNTLWWLHVCTIDYHKLNQQQ